MTSTRNIAQLVMGFTDPFADSYLGSVLFIVYISVTCIMACGLVTNALLIYSVLRQPRLRRSPTYVTLVSLATSDFLGLGRGLLFKGLLYTTEPSRTLCLPLVYTGAAAFCTSSYHLMLFSVLRYVTLVKPLLAMKHLTAKTSVVICVMTWTAALTFSFPSLIFSDVASFNTTANKTVPVCIQRTTSTTYVISAAIVLVFVPMTVMVVFHIAKVCQLRQSLIRPKDAKGRHVSAKIVASVLITFAVTSLPNAMFWSALPAVQDISLEVVAMGYILSDISNINSAVDPLLYFFFSKRARENISCCHWFCKERNAVKAEIKNISRLANVCSPGSSYESDNL